jgi:hypothetical protein
MRSGDLRLSKAGRFVACLAMVGVGAIVGTIAGGHTNAARLSATGPSELADHSLALASVVEAPVQSDVADVMASAAPADSASARTPAAVIAARFPTQWQQAAVPVARDRGQVVPGPVMAYAAETRAERPAADSFQLASVDSAPVALPKRIERPAQPKPAVLFNDAQLASIKARLRLTRDQEQYWPQVEQALRAISWRIASQQAGKRVVQGNQAAMIDPNSPEVARLKSAAFPLIMSMREEQKQEVRQLAHTMGLKQVAAMF